MIREIIKSYKESPSIVYFLLEKKPVFIGIVAVLAFVFRFILSIQSNDISDAVGDSIGFASMMTAAVVAILLYFKDAVNLQIVKRISQSNHTAVFGLGEFSTALLQNEIDEDKIYYIIFEKSVQNEQIEHFRKAGMGVIQGNAFNKEHLEKFNFHTMDHALITLGNDRFNIELATIIIDLYKEQKITTPIKLIVHIINKDLNALFHQKFIAPEADGNHKIDIQSFSFYDECAETFFEHNFIDGENSAIMQSSDDYNIVVTGNGELALNIMFQAARIAHLPNENRLNIHIVDKNAEAVKKRLIKRYNGIEKVVTLTVHNFNDETLEYFEQSNIWMQKNLTHVIICYDDEERNIKIATDLFDKTYLALAVDGLLRTRISFAMFNAYALSGKINGTNDNFKQFYSFGDVKEICTCKNLIDEKHDLIAKLVHKGYADEYAPETLYDLEDKAMLKAIESRWYDASRLSDKLSSKAQSKHIDMKLKAVGLARVHSDKPAEELLKLNRALFDDVLKVEREALGLSDLFLKEYSKELPKLWDDKLKSREPINIRYFPKSYDTLFEKLIRAEHNRWNAFHYLNGWVYNEVKSKAKKEHNCLMPLAEFQMPELQLTVIYDIYSILYIPNYLANSGYLLISALVDENI